MANPCAICGTTESETYRFCSARKDFVCLQCERACMHYSREMLPNGTNCRLSRPPQQRFKYLVVESEAMKFKEKYAGMTKSELKEVYKSLKGHFHKTETPEARVELRNRLAAIEFLLEECA